MAEQKANSTYYDLLGLTPGASVQEIRRAYRELSKLYHPDTTALPTAIATAKFQDLNEAYATLSSLERRSSYDLKIGYSRVRVMQAPVDFKPSVSDGRRQRYAYFDSSDRPLSAGEIFALFILGVTFVGCLILVIAVGMTRGDFALNLFDPGKVAETVPGDRPLASPQPASDQTYPAAPLLPSSSTANFDAERTNAASAASSYEPDVARPEIFLPDVVPDVVQVSPAPGSTDALAKESL